MASHPRGGFLNGMGITLSGLAVAVAVGLSPEWHQPFLRPPSEASLDALAVSTALMVLHKAESYRSREFDVAPVYLRAGDADVAHRPREAVFRTFVATFLTMQILLVLALRGGPWPMLLLGVWIAQGVQELHHIAKSVAHRAWYAGTATSMLFSGTVLGWLYPVWAADLGLEPERARLIWIGIAPLFALLWWEQRTWIRQSTEQGLAVPYGAGPDPDQAPGGVSDSPGP